MSLFISSTHVDIDTRDEVTRTSLLHFTACGGCGGATLKLLETNANPLFLDEVNRLSMIMELTHHYDAIAEMLMEHKLLDFKRSNLVTQSLPKLARISSLPWSVASTQVRQSWPKRSFLGVNNFSFRPMSGSRLVQ